MISIMTQHKKLVEIGTLCLDCLLHTCKLLVIGYPLFSESFHNDFVSLFYRDRFIEFDHRFVKPIFQHTNLLQLIVRLIPSFFGDLFIVLISHILLLLVKGVKLLNNAFLNFIFFHCL